MRNVLVFAVVLLMAAGLMAYQRGMTGKDVFIPASAQAPGAHGTYWTTNVRLYNPGTTRATITATFYPRSDIDASSTSTTVEVGAGQVMEYGNVMYELFGFDTSQALAGAIRFQASSDIQVVSRTSTPAAGRQAGSYGFNVPGYPAEWGVTPGNCTTVLAADNNTDWRSNLALLDISGGGSTGTIYLYDANGNLVDSADFQLAPYENTQYGLGQWFPNSGGVFANYTVDICVNSGKVLGYMSIIDNATGDPWGDGVYKPAVSGGGNGGGGECTDCLDAILVGYFMQVQNADWEGYINNPISMTVQNSAVTYINPLDFPLVYITPSNYVIMLGFDADLAENPLDISSTPASFEVVITYTSTETGKEVLEATFDGSIDSYTCPGYMTMTLTATIVAKDPDYVVLAGQYYWSGELGLMPQ